MADLLFYNYILFSWVIYLSFVGSILVLLILAVKKLCAKRLGTKFQYLIWFIIVLRLMMPKLPSSFFSIFNFMPQFKRTTPVVTIKKGDLNRAELQKFKVKTNSVQISDAYSKTSDENITKLLIFLSIAWGVGALSIGILKICAYIRFKTRIDKLPLIDDDKVINIFKSCKSEVNITKRIKLIKTKDAVSPSVVGFINPMILLPENIFEIIPEEKIRYVFIHELVHLKHYDTLTNWLVLILKTLHWFNPIIQYGFNRMNTDMEIFCDSETLTLIRDEEVKEYGLTIINIAASISKFKKLPGAASMVSDKCHIKRRIVMIKLFNKNSCRLSAAALAILMTLSCTILTDAKASSVKEEIKHGILNSDESFYKKPISNANGDNTSTRYVNPNATKSAVNKNLTCGNQTLLSKNTDAPKNHESAAYDNSICSKPENIQSNNESETTSDSNYISESEIGTTINSFAFKGDTYNLPSEVRVPVEKGMVYSNSFGSYKEMLMNSKDNKVRHILIDWDKKVDTNTVSRCTYYGYVHGYPDEVKVNLTVYDMNNDKSFPRLSDVPQVPQIPQLPSFSYSKEIVSSDESKVSYYYLLNSVPDYQIYLNPYNSILEKAGWKSSGVSGSGSGMQFIYKKNQQSITIGFGNLGTSTCFIVSGNVH